MVHINDATHWLTWLSTNQDHANKLLYVYTSWLHFADLLYSYLWWYETWNWEHKWRKYFMVSCLFPLIPWYSMEKCINLNVKFLTSVTFCVDDDGIRMRCGIGWDGMGICYWVWVEDKEPTETNEEICYTKMIVLCYCSEIQYKTWNNINTYTIYNFCCCQFKLLFSQEWETGINQLANGLFHLCLQQNRAEQNSSKASKSMFSSCFTEKLLRFELHFSLKILSRLQIWSLSFATIEGTMYYAYIHVWRLCRLCCVNVAFEHSRTSLCHMTHITLNIYTRDI